MTLILSSKYLITIIEAHVADNGNKDKLYYNPKQALQLQ